MLAQSKHSFQCRETGSAHGRISGRASFVPIVGRPDPHQRFTVVILDLGHFSFFLFFSS